MRRYYRPICSELKLSKPSGTHDPFSASVWDGRWEKNKEDPN